MHVHVVRNVDFEGPGLIAEWAQARRHSLAESLALTESYPDPASVDLLAIMGGPMAADDETTSPWLAAEKRFVADAIARGCAVVGVCLGAQVLAEVAGGTVCRNAEREIGWYPVRLTPAGRVDPVFSAFPDGLVVGHWHGDTFTLPPGAIGVLTSDATANQAFTLEGGRVVALQFHLEWTAEIVDTLLARCAEDLAPGPWVATAQELREQAPSRLDACRDALYSLLDASAAQAFGRDGA